MLTLPSAESAQRSKVTGERRPDEPRLLLHLCECFFHRGGFEREAARFGKEKYDDYRTGYREEAQVTDDDRQAAQAAGQNCGQGLSSDRGDSADQRVPSHHRAPERSRKKFGRK